MRLLQVDENGEFSLTDDLDSNIPPYAILSHTWAEDHEEVNFRDLMIGPRKTKSGYEKLRFCAERTARDGLQYFCVDTCCIDKSNNTELSEAINSMFRWYRDATKCYVYLSDIATNSRQQLSMSPQSWEPAFRKSRWFTRGWTLQELLAPPSVEFFCSGRNLLGDRQSLERLLHEITGIAVEALQGLPLSEFSINERMLWAETRQTKREEDKAYSLLGIFGIHIPLIYGEGGASAFKRLQEEINKNSRPGQDPNLLDRLPYATEAPFNSYAKQHESVCLPDIRIELLQEIYNWADRQDERTIFWLSGLAGTGKSTVARTVAQYYFDKKRLGASFFFSSGGGDVSSASKFVTSIAVQLTTSLPVLHRHVSDAVMACGDIASRSLRDQWRELVIQPLEKLDSNNCQLSYIIVVDALDKCNDESNIRIILHLLAEARLLERVPIRVLLTSRPEISIRYGFSHIPAKEHHDFMLYNISLSTINYDITIFLEYNLKLIREERSLGPAWPGEEVIRRLVQATSGLFIWAATACRFVRDGKRLAARRLDMLVQSSGSNATAPEKHLNEIYTTVLRQSIPIDYTDEEREESYRMLRQVLGNVIVLFSTLSIYALSKLLCIPSEEINQTVEDLYSILDVPNDQTRPLCLYYPSFRDFLLDKERCKDLNFWVDKKQAYQRLANDCITLMSTSLKQDICGQSAPGMLAANVKSSQVEQGLPPELQYACLYWVQHLQQSYVQLRDNDQVHQFLQEYLLHWLEALGWMGKVSEGIYALASLESFALPTSSPCLSKFIHDARRFILYNRLAIEQAPLQTYCGALIFTPMGSIIRKQFEHCIPRWILRLPEVENTWNTLLQTLEGHSDEVRAVAFSPDGKTVASASRDATVKVWEAGSGALLQTLEGHSGSVEAVSFSPNGKTLASASRDTTVKVWDAGSGTVLQTLNAHLGSVEGVAFSPDSKTLASISHDGKIKLWDAGLGAVLQTLDGHTSSVEAGPYSWDGGKTLTSVSHDGAIKVWDASSGVVLQTLEGEPGSVEAVAFSRDGKTLALVLYDGKVKVWDTGSGAVLHTLDGYTGLVVGVDFSGNGGKMLTTMSHDGTVRVWDASSGAVLYMIEGKSDSVEAVAFSPDGKTLASASHDRMVKLWDVGSGTVLWTLEGHSDLVSAVAFSADGKMLASASRDRTVRLWDAGSGTALQTLEILQGSRFDMVIAMAFSPCGKILALATLGQKVRLCDTGSGAVLQTLEDQSCTINAVAFSPDGKTLASAWTSLWAPEDKAVKLWDADSGTVLRTLKADFDIWTLSFSADGAVLQTNSGPLHTASFSDSAALSRASLLPSAFIRFPEHWVGWGKENVLWLPSGYRTKVMALCGGIIGFGYSSGRVVIMELAF